MLGKPLLQLLVVVAVSDLLLPNHHLLNFLLLPFKFNTLKLSDYFFFFVSEKQELETIPLGGGLAVADSRRALLAFPALKGGKGMLSCGFILN